MDELLVQTVTEFEGKRLQSVTQGPPQMGDEEDRKRTETKLQEQSAEYAPLIERLEKALAGQVQGLRLSTRLTTAPACLAGDAFGLSPRMERLLLKGKGGGPRRRRTLEINPDHPLIAACE